MRSNEGFSWTLPRSAVGSKPFDARGDACDCRKPRSGMITRLADELNIDLRRSWMIGDSESDILAGRAAGRRTVLVGQSQIDVAPDVVAPSLSAASELILECGQLRSARRQTRTPGRARDTSASALPAGRSRRASRAARRHVGDPCSFSPAPPAGAGPTRVAARLGRILDGVEDVRDVVSTPVETLNVPALPTAASNARATS